MEDSQIIELYWQKNPEAISETAGKYGAYCFTIADNILQSAEDSEECVNDLAPRLECDAAAKAKCAADVPGENHPQSFL